MNEKNRLVFKLHGGLCFFFLFFCFIFHPASDIDSRKMYDPHANTPIESNAIEQSMCGIWFVVYWWVKSFNFLNKWDNNSTKFVYIVHHLYSAYLQKLIAHYNVFRSQRAKKESMVKILISIAHFIWIIAVFQMWISISKPNERA